RAHGLLSLLLFTCNRPYDERPSALDHHAHFTGTATWRPRTGTNQPRLDAAPPARSSSRSMRGSSTGNGPPPPVRPATRVPHPWHSRRNRLASDPVHLGRCPAAAGRRI